MANKYRKLKSRKGTTMVEVVLSVLLLALVVTAVLTVMGFSQRLILSNSSETKAAAQAQEITDALITRLHSTKESDFESLEVCGAKYVEKDKFPLAEEDKQFTVSSVQDEDGVDGYKIETAVYFSDGKDRKCVRLSAFSAKEGGGTS